MYTKEELISMGFAYVGNDVKVFKKTTLVNPANISLSDGCQIDDFVHIIAAQPINIGKRCHIATQCTITGGGQFDLEDYASLAAGCRIITGSDDFLGEALNGPCMPIEYRKINRSFVRIKRHAVLATNSIVLPGVTIEEGAVSTVATVFYQNSEPWFVYKGNPAVRVGRRRQNIIKTLEKEMIEKYGY